jgi:hypothetical protein
MIILIGRRFGAGDPSRARTLPPGEWTGRSAPSLCFVFFELIHDVFNGRAVIVLRTILEKKTDFQAIYTYAANLIDEEQVFPSKVSA